MAVAVAESVAVQGDGWRGVGWQWRHSSEIETTARFRQFLSSESDLARAYKDSLGK